MQNCIRHFLVISRESTPFVNAAAAVFLPRGSRLRETANSRPPVDNVRLRQDCIRHFVFHCDGGVTLTPRKTTFSGDVSLTLNMTVHFVRTPIFGYALPLKRERWHALRAEEGATLPKVATLPLFGD